jgi:hypothetical protein
VCHSLGCQKDTKKFQIDTLGDHLGTCTTHSGAKKTQDWTIDQLADLFRTTYRVKTQQVVKSRGQHCGDIEIAGYLQNAVGTVSLVMDLRILMSVGEVKLTLLVTGTYKPLNEEAVDKIRKYRSNYNNNPPNAISFMPAIASTSGRIHSEFVRIFFSRS